LGWDAPVEGEHKVRPWPAWLALAVLFGTLTRAPKNVVDLRHFVAGVAGPDGGTQLDIRCFTGWRRVVTDGTVEPTFNRWLLVEFRPDFNLTETRAWHTMAWQFWSAERNFSITLGLNQVWTL
jgi:hypothetical protein